ncbi:MAG: hypothetical protein HY543_02480, partial [Deltaproteobacteria bacterium]|nr:hypothetical protein [Deltaproteobacteria bacterium]
TGLARSVLIFDPAARNFKIDSWLTLDGKVSTTVSQAAITITDSDTGATVFGMPLTSTTPSAGIFRLTWLFKDSGGVTLLAKTYKATTTITTTAGTTFQGMDIIDTRTQVAIGTNFGTLVLPGGASDLGAQIEAAKQDIKADIAGVKTTVDSIKTDTSVNLPAQIGTLQTDVTAILEDTTSIPAQLTDIQQRITAEYRAKILPRDPITLINTATMIRFRTVTALAPLMTVYQGSTPFVTNVPMPEIGTTGIYSATFTPTAIGEFMVIVQEPTNGSTDSMTITARAANETTIMDKLTALDTQVQTTLTNNINTLLGKWGTQDAATMQADLNDLVANLGAATDTSAANTLFGTAKFIKEKWGTQDAQALYDQVVTAYNKAVAIQSDLALAKSDLTLHVTTTTNAAKTEILTGMTNLQNTVQASVGAIDVAVLELTDISTQIGPSVTSLTSASGAISTQVSNLEAAASEVTQSISAMEASADAVEAAAAGIDTTVKESEAKVKAHMQTQRELLQSDIISKTKEMTDAMSTRTGETLAAMQAGKVAMMGAVTAGTSETISATTALGTKIGSPDGSNSVYGDLLALRTIVTDIQTKVDAVKSGSGGAGSGAGSGGSSTAGGSSTGSSGTGGSATDDLSTKLDSVITDLNSVQSVVDTMAIDLDDVGEDASKAATFAMTASSSASAAQAAATELKATLAAAGGKLADQLVGALLGKLTEIQSDVSVIRAKSASGEGLSAELKAALAQLAGFKMDDNGQFTPETLAQSQEVQALQGDVNEVKALLEVINTLVRQQSTRPVIKTWFETGD